METCDDSQHSDGQYYENSKKKNVKVVRYDGSQRYNINLPAKDTQIDPESDGRDNSQIKSDGRDAKKAFQSQLQFRGSAFYSVDRQSEQNTKPLKVQRASYT